MNKFNVVYCCGRNNSELERQIKDVNKYLKKVKVFHPKILLDNCDGNIDLLDRASFKELQHYLDNERINTLFVPSVKVLGNDANILANYIVYLYKSGVTIKVANKDERRVVQQFIREVHIASHKK